MIRQTYPRERRKQKKRPNMRVCRNWNCWNTFRPNRRQTQLWYCSTRCERICTGRAIGWDEMKDWSYGKHPKEKEKPQRRLRKKVKNNTVENFQNKAVSKYSRYHSLHSRGWPM